MKKLILLFTGICISMSLLAQAPNAFQYQAVARDNYGDIIANQEVSFQISILQGSATGSAVYTETHTDSTNDYGLVTLAIGSGNTSDDFSAIDWANGPFYVKVEMDESGGSDYKLMGTSQLLSVPYAMQAQQANTFNALQAKGSEVCNSENEGIMRYDSSTQKVEYCNGSDWMVLSGGLSVATPTLTTATISNITINSAVSGGNITDNGGASIIEKGICWNTVTAPTISNDKTQQGTGSDAFTSNLTGLTSNDVYYVRSYGTNTAGTGYGNEESFTTLADLTTTSASNNTLTGFETGGDITVGGGESITARGVVYNTSGTPTTSDNAISGGTGTGSFTSSITSLPNNTKYYFRAYATNVGGTNYGNEKTTATLASLTSSDQSSATTSSVTVGGDIATGGGASITAGGVAYGNSSNPDISGNKTTDGSGTGSFTSTPSGLQSNTLYHYRAYATNEGGTNYGTDKTATTLAELSATKQGPSDTLSTSFETGGTVEYGGGESITKRGVVYGNSSNPTKSDNYQAAASGGSGSFTVTLSGLSGLIYYRAYAENAGGISYGPEYSIAIIQSGSGVTDEDGNSYNTIIIGDQEWMAENLRTTHYADGTPIQKVTGDTEWDNLGTSDKAYCWYNNDSASNAETYGALYTWAAAMNGAASSNSNPSGVQGVCPDGWHLPSDDEWSELESALGGGSNVGSKLADSANLWQDGDLENNAAFGISGFTALSGGVRLNSGNFGLIGANGYWWSSLELSSTIAYYRYLYYDSSFLNRNFGLAKEVGFSVRCVRDD